MAFIAGLLGGVLLAAAWVMGRLVYQRMATEAGRSRCAACGQPIDP